MSDIKDISKRLASLAVFREIYNSKKDVYGVIAEFLNEIIAAEGLHQFNLTEITNLLNATFDFSIPEAVINSSLRRLDYINKERGIYIANPLPKISAQNISILEKDIIASNELIISDLFSFIELEQKNKLSDPEKERIVHSFCSFVLDNSNGSEYSEYISGFVIQNNNKDFRDKLNKIREGIVLYSGLTYNNNVSEVGSWKTELTIYLDTELLFHFVGYNGELYKSLFYDFFNYVKEINNKASKHLIKLRYFKEVADEIERFFSKAKYIVEGKERPNPKVTAMHSVLEGCKEASDVMDKMSDFYLLLKNNNIKQEESCDYFDKGNYEYNIIDKDTIEAISKEVEFDLEDHLCFLNYVHINRKDANLNNFYNIGCILLTGNYRTIKVAWHNLIKQEGVVPLATTLDWITNKFWYKLNKGFGGGDLPKSFDIITKAQIILSSVLNKSVGKKYDEFQNQFKDGTITEEQVKARFVNLRSQARKPEEILQDEVSLILDVISEDSLEKFLADQEYFKVKAKKQAEENINLKKEIIEKDNKIDEIVKNQEELTLQNIELNERRLQEKLKTIEILEKQKLPIDIEVEKEFRFFKIKTLGVLVFFYVLSFFLIWKYGWQQLEQYAWMVSAIIPLISLGYILAKEKTLNPLEFLKNKKQYIQDRKYSQFTFDRSLLDGLKIEKDKLIIEIDSLKANIK